MNYRIVGHDGKTYGPVNADQIRAWIAQGRVESRTPVFVEGATDWSFVGILPEFAGHFSQTPPIIETPPATSAQVKKTNGFATAGLVCGTLSVVLVCCCGGFPLNILGIIFSIIALAQINEKPERHDGRTLAIIGLVLSVLSFLILAFLLASDHSHAHIWLNNHQF